MGVSLARHDELLRGCIAGRGGYVFTTGGDSFAVAFETADQAAAAAQDIQRTVGEEPWPERTPIRVRIGLHTGTADIRDGDYFGTEVARAARIEAAAHGGQIVLSPTTASLVTDLALRSLGLHQLKDFPTEIELHQLGDGDFPPLRTITARNTNLSRTSAALVGRGADTLRLRELAEHSRLVTVTGAGGIGKTALMHAFGHTISQHSDLEVWWCDLVSAEPEDVAFHVGKAVGLTSGANDPRVVAESLARRPGVTLLLDNCDHVVGAAAALVAYVLEASEARVVATSRVPLGMADESIMALGPLDAATTAVDLFVREASRIGSLGVGPDDRELVISICRRVDGMPLAIELVAARTRTLSLVDIDTRLDQMLSTQGRRQSDDDRHRTMSSTIDWSTELLDEPIRHGLGALAVFAGGFDFAAAEAILGAETDLDPLLVLEELIDHSLLEQRRVGERRRYRLLEPIRQYAAAKLWSDPDATRHRHLEHYLGRLEAAYETMGRTSCMPFIDFIRVEMDNLEAVHDWALQSGRISDDLRLYPLLGDPWLYDDGRVLSWALETVDLPGVDTLPGWAALWVSAVNALAFGASREETAAMYARYDGHQPDDHTAAWAAKNFAGNSMYVEGDTEKAIAQLEDFATSPDPGLRFHHYFNTPAFMIVGAEATHDLVPDEIVDSALAKLDDGLAWAARIGARNFEAAFLQVAASILVRTNRPYEAVVVARDVEQLSAALGMTGQAAMATHHIAHAGLLGVDIGEPVRECVVRVLEADLRIGLAIAARHTVPAAARVLAAEGEHELAALCMTLRDGYWPDRLPTLALDDIPDEVWERARSRGENLHVLEVARLAVDALNAAPENGL